VERFLRRSDERNLAAGISGAPIPCFIFRTVDFTLAQWNTLHPGAEPPPELFVTARELPAAAHLDMQAALQPFVDNAISKTITLAADVPFSAFRDVFEQAWIYRRLGQFFAFPPRLTRGSRALTRRLHVLTADLVCSPAG